MIYTLTLIATLGTEICGPAVELTYSESAPADFVVVRHLSPQGWSLEAVNWDLTPSNGALVFDTVEGGLGIGQSAAFNRLDGDVTLSDIPLIADGGSSLTLSFDAFPAGAMFRFSIDLDDTVSGASGTMISNSELAGAQVTAEFVHVTMATVSRLEGAFGPDATATLKTGCTS